MRGSPSARLACLALLVALGAAMAPAAAQDWRPFPEDERRVVRPRPPAGDDVAPPRPRDDRPYLPPMAEPPQREAARPPGDEAAPRRDPYGQPWRRPADPSDIAIGREPPPAGTPPRDREWVPPPRDRERVSPPSPLAPPPMRPGPADPNALPPLDERARGVERGELTPVLSADGSGLPLDLWKGLDMKGLEELLAKVDIPPRSPTLHGLWRRMMLSEATPPGGTEFPGHFQALRLEGLYRAGLITAAAEAMSKPSAGPAEPLIRIIEMRIRLAVGAEQDACKAARDPELLKAQVLERYRLEAFLMAAWCAAATGNTAAAALKAELAREAGLDAPLAFTVLDALNGGAKPRRLELPKRLTLIDYKLAALLGGLELQQVVDRAEPALLAALALDQRTEPALRVAAAEAAAVLNAVSAVQLAEVYRAANVGVRELGAGGLEGAMRRAALYSTIEAEQGGVQRLRLVRAMLDDARKSDVYVAVAAALAPALAGVQIGPEAGVLVETAIEVALISGDHERVRRLATGTASPGAVGPRHWEALADMADAGPRSRRAESLRAIEDLAARGRFGADVLHRIATVLDALDTHIPIPLWEQASRTPQPAGGHLPATGVLAQLNEAAKQRSVARTALLVMQTVGPGPAEGAHMIALGDAIRALKRVGLEADARRIGFEALFLVWPRQVAN